MELPEKITMNTYCILNRNQEIINFGETTLLTKKVKLNNTKDQLNLLPRNKLQQSLPHVMSLKQLCNHPLQYEYQKQRELLCRESNKMIKLIKIIKQHKNERGLIFTQIVKHHLLFAIFEKENIKVLFLHGGCEIKERTEIVNKFQDPLFDINILIISLFTVSTGLKLTAATYVTHFDLWWNAALQDQATDRAYRKVKNILLKYIV